VVIPVFEKKKKKSEAKFGPKNGCNALIVVNESCHLVNYTGHSENVLRDTAAYARK
jgi:hypothetical protein